MHEKTQYPPDCCRKKSEFSARPSHQQYLWDANGLFVQEYGWKYCDHLQHRKDCIWQYDPLKLLARLLNRFKRLCTGGKMDSRVMPCLQKHRFHSIGLRIGNPPANIETTLNHTKPLPIAEEILMLRVLYGLYMHAYYLYIYINIYMVPHLRSTLSCST